MLGQKKTNYVYYATQFNRVRWSSLVAAGTKLKSIQSEWGLCEITSVILHKVHDEMQRLHFILCFVFCRVCDSNILEKSFHSSFIWTGSSKMVMQSEQYSAFIAIACMIGTGLSVYSYYVETMLAEDSSYEAMCDISEQISCSKVFTSEWVCS